MIQAIRHRDRLAELVVDDAGGVGQGIGDGQKVPGDSAMELFRLTCTIAVPNAAAVSCPADTMTVAGTVTIPDGTAVTCMVVALDCTALMVTIRLPVAPRLILVVGGSSETMVGRWGVTVIVLVALVPLRLAVMTAVPGVLAETAMGAVVCPAGTVTVAGTEAMPAALLVSVMVVGLDCAALIVTVRAPVPPWVMVSEAGWRLAIVGGAALTSTMAPTEPSFRVTVICAWSTATVVTGMAILV